MEQQLHRGQFRPEDFTGLRPGSAEKMAHGSRGEPPALLPVALPG
jgi:hypothetical protein